MVDVFCDGGEFQAAWLIAALVWAKASLFLWLTDCGKYCLLLSFDFGSVRLFIE